MPAEMCIVHGTCVLLARAAAAFGAPEDAGILLLGESGAGKSDLALRLIERGAMLVADDRVELFARSGRIFGRSPQTLAGLIEVRRVGIIRIPYASEAAICLAIALDPPKASPRERAAPRLPEPAHFQPPAGLTVPDSAWPPLLDLAAFDSSAPARLVLAAAAFAHERFYEGPDAT